MSFAEDSITVTWDQVPAFPVPVNRFYFERVPDRALISVEVTENLDPSVAVFRREGNTMRISAENGVAVYHLDRLDAFGQCWDAHLVMWQYREPREGVRI